MQVLLEFLPLLAFMVAYYGAGIYAATGALMAAMGLVLGVDWLRERRIPPMHGISAALVFVFGAATLGLRDERFIQWKPTVFFWAVGLAFLGSQWFGRQPLAQRLMGAALGGQLGAVTRGDWLRLNLVWVAFYAIMGTANLVVLLKASQQVWVSFKVFGITGLTLLFVVGQSIWLTRRAGLSEDPAT